MRGLGLIVAIATMLERASLFHGPRPPLAATASPAPGKTASVLARGRCSRFPVRGEPASPLSDPCMPVRPRPRAARVLPSMQRWFATVGSSFLLLVGALSAARADQPAPPEPAKTSEAAKPPERGEVGRARQGTCAQQGARGGESAGAGQGGRAGSGARYGPPATRPGRAWGTIAAALLFIPRKTVELIFPASGTTAGLIRDEQVVPRRGGALASVGEITIFPTIRRIAAEHERRRSCPRAHRSRWRRRWPSGSAVLTTSTARRAFVTRSPGRCRSSSTSRASTTSARD